jgi:hypothetical protein
MSLQQVFISVILIKNMIAVAFAVFPFLWFIVAYLMHLRKQDMWFFFFLMAGFFSMIILGSFISEYTYVCGWCGNVSYIGQEMYDNSSQRGIVTALLSSIWLPVIVFLMIVVILWFLSMLTKKDSNKIEELRRI